MAETSFAMIVTLICVLPIIIFGIVQYRSKKPVGFWSGMEPPKKEQITDVKAYNKKHGLMWIYYGLGFVLCFECGLFLGETMAAILSVTECIGGLIVMILYHNKLNRMYIKKDIKQEGKRMHEKS